MGAWARAEWAGAETEAERPGLRQRLGLGLRRWFGLSLRQRLRIKAGAGAEG